MNVFAISITTPDHKGDWNGYGFSFVICNAGLHVMTAKTYLRRGHLFYDEEKGYIKAYYLCGLRVQFYGFKKPSPLRDSNGVEL